MKNNQISALTTSLAASTGGGLRGSPKNTISGGTLDWIQKIKIRMMRKIKKMMRKRKRGNKGSKER